MWWQKKTSFIFSWAINICVCVFLCAYKPFSPNKCWLFTTFHLATVPNFFFRPFLSQIFQTLMIHFLCSFVYSIRSENVFVWKIGKLWRDLPDVRIQFLLLLSSMLLLLLLLEVKRWWSLRQDPSQIEAKIGDSHICFDWG